MMEIGFILTMGWITSYEHYPTRVVKYRVANQYWYKPLWIRKILPYWIKWLFVRGRESGGESVCYHNPIGGG